ncbi:MAG: ABC transporter ATP-binding protein [Anaerovoracaceae bacterium]|nr:ABC transporter ATP-binding protein [Anaerovoracaceae bacterium]
MRTELVAECRNLTKNFSGVKALNSIDLRLERGKIIGLLGPNGSGKTTLIKILNGLLEPTFGEVLIDGEHPGVHTKSVVSYLPDKTYFADWMRVTDIFDIFEDFYADFDRQKAESMCLSMGIKANDKIKTMSKGTKEKVQLILVMSRKAQLYLLDEPIAGVDPAARDYILTTIINNYNEEGTVVISTHLISDIERILDEVVFIKNGVVVRHEAVDDIKEKEGKSIDDVFKDTFRMFPFMGVNGYDR